MGLKTNEVPQKEFSLSWELFKKGNQKNEDIILQRGRRGGREKEKRLLIIQNSDYFAW